MDFDGATEELRQFWPSGGPSWDALAVVEPASEARPRGVLLVEAKSYPEEILGPGCQATDKRSLAMITEAVLETKRWLGVATSADWMGPLYQVANRLAHLYFFRERTAAPAWLVSVCFLHDPYRPTGTQRWIEGLAGAFEKLGLGGKEIPHYGVVFLPALNREPGPQAADVEAG